MIRKVAQDLVIFNTNRHTQFQELIVHPFAVLRTQRQAIAKQFFVIILEGLDERKDREAQCELVKMISYHVQKEPNPRLCWMICSRSEPALKLRKTGRLKRMFISL
ncbi:hypothetical protein D9756_009937 [Leucocoprinus leucothites]|uniref:NACHT domain-containing protein n=1 Tax=Leucocoprinus leucothites TaxID=201217 RepID=A0A8H5FSC6_9AGAR|nr:hypothetical protein D9756_009937 [Leucoagaricus leucothites]